MINCLLFFLLLFLFFFFFFLGELSCSSISAHSVAGVYAIGRVIVWEVSLGVSIDRMLLWVREARLHFAVGVQAGFGVGWVRVVVDLLGFLADRQNKRSNVRFA